MYVCLGSSLCIHIYSRCLCACVCVHAFTFMYNRRPKADLWILFQYVSILFFERRAGLLSKTLDSSAGISGRPPMPQWHIHGVWGYEFLVLMLSTKHISQCVISQRFYLYTSLVLNFLKSSNMEPPYNHAIPLLGTPLRSENFYVQKHLYRLVRWLTR